MSVVQYNFPTVIRFGAGASEELGPHLKEQGLSAPLIVSDPGLVQLGFFKKIMKDLKGQGLKAEVFTDISKNPVKSDVHRGADAFHQFKSDCIIGIGGGASMDVARAIALKANHQEDLFYYEDTRGGAQYVVNEIPYFVTIPTTSGTGSEVGRSSIISDDETHKKNILFHPNLLAKIVFADPLLTMELPGFITAATGIDALTHNIEAYVAKTWHPMCEGIALEGIKLIAQSIETATHRPDVVSRSKMMIASLMGAVAFQKGLGVVHSLAHPMSTLFDTHHGLANALNLPYGVRFNQEVAFDKMETIAKVFKTNNLFQYLLELNQKLGLPTNLRSQGIKEEDLEKLSELAYLDFCHPDNPRPVTQKDFLALYKEVL